MPDSIDNHRPILVIMAAGLGSRFGGVKQLARVGPDDEAIIDLSIKDGLAAGFDQIVLIVRSEIEDDVRAHIDSQHDQLDVVYVRQDELGPARSKPWGTLHAVLSAADAIDRSCAVINADDYYGPETFRMATGMIPMLRPGLAANIVFQLGHTVPPSGAVTRAVTEVANGCLTAIVETEGCQRMADGTFSAGGREVPADTPVSMNFWLFHDSILGDFRERWEAFLAVNADEEKAEAFLPTVVGELMDEGRVEVRVEQSPEQWIGITNPEDLELVRSTLSQRV